MKKFLPKLLLFVVILSCFVAVPRPTQAQNLDTQLPQVGSWIRDPEVTRVGKNASRSGMLLDWTLKEYRWTAQSYDGTNNPLVPFWQIVQRIVYALFLVVIMITAFILIVTRGKSLSAKRFLPRFFLVILLVTFSFSLVQFLYQITDIFQGFFLRNPQGAIISSRDLLFIGFDYRTFEGLRRFGPDFDETAFTSLLFVKLTAFTYYAMSILLIIRKIILWFFVVISPVFPLLILFYPVRNTAKIWIGEFFRWLLYAPLFAIFLSGLVRLWQSNLPLLFSNEGVGDPSKIIYPTAINILLGGPQQQVGINNSINLPDTFALYLVAIIMLWVVIILPFILLQIFLDYMMAFNYRENPAVKQMMGIINNRLTPPANPKTPIIPVGPVTTGMARNLPFTRKYTAPTSTGLAREIPRATNISQRTRIDRSTPVLRSKTAEISRLTNLSIPTMRDIARYEREKLANSVLMQKESVRTQEILRNIANPASIPTVTERDRFRQIREKLVTESTKGDQISSSVLNAASLFNSYVSSSSTQSASNTLQTIIQQLANPSVITNTTDREKITEVREKLISVKDTGKEYVTSILKSISVQDKSQTKETSLQSVLQKLSQTNSITDQKEKLQYQTLREKITDASRSGNQLATLVKESLEKSTSSEQVQHIQQELIRAKEQGNPLAGEILKQVQNESEKAVDSQTIITQLEEAKKQGDPLATLLLQLITQKKSQTQKAPVPANAKTKSGSFPVVNRIQQVSLDDYEAVKKMWSENYRDLDVPQSISGTQSRKQWISSDIADIEQTINLLTSQNSADVEEGMKQVADILPFLLIGGFSQTEIVAYLKAKLEAGKSVLEEVEKQVEEEDTLLETKRRTTENEKYLAASQEINETNYSQNTKQSVTNNFNTTYVSNEYSEATGDQSDVSTPTSTLLQLTHLSLPTIKDIVRFEQSKIAERKEMLSESERILTYLAHPERLSSEERVKYQELHEQLLTESEKGNTVARAILAATSPESQTNEITDENMNEFIESLQSSLTTIRNQSDIKPEDVKKVLLSLTNAENLSQQKDKELYMQIKQEILTNTSSSVAQQLREILNDPSKAVSLDKLSSDIQLAKTNGDKIAEDISHLLPTLVISGGSQKDSLVTKIQTTLQSVQKHQTQNIVRFLEKLGKPEQISVATERTNFTKLVERLSQEQDINNLSATLLNAAKDENKEMRASEVYSMLKTEVQKGDPLALYITQSLLPPSKEVSTSVREIYKEIVREKEKGNKVAEKIFDSLAKPYVKTRKLGAIVLPRQNRVQQVSLDDYEAVKKLWYEIYLQSDVPKKGEEVQTREEWIKGDQEVIQQVINLLSSENEEEIASGMEIVKDILPFLLIGGFSKDEVIGYLKAKQEAGSMALETLQARTEGEDTKMVVEKSHEQSLKQSAQEMPLEEKQG